MKNNKFIYSFYLLISAIIDKKEFLSEMINQTHLNRQQNIVIVMALALALALLSQTQITLNSCTHCALL